MRQFLSYLRCSRSRAACHNRHGGERGGPIMAHTRKVLVRGLLRGLGWTYLALARRHRADGTRGQHGGGA